jgi:hypothetical protein
VFPVYTALTFATRVPPHARTAAIRTRVNQVAAAVDALASLRQGAGFNVSASMERVASASGIAGFREDVTIMDLDATQSLEFSTVGAGAATLDLDCDGWVE